MSFIGTQQKCKACGKTVYPYPVELLSVDGIAKLSNYSSTEGVLYCQPHFEQLFKESGNLNKNFTSPAKVAEKLSPMLVNFPPFLHLVEICRSDIYSFGVVLWELTTEKIPWDSHSMQVIGAVGFMNQRLDIPKDVDPQWASLIESCWFSDPQSRPTFQEILDKLKELQKKFNVQLQAWRTASATTPSARENNGPKES